MSRQEDVKVILDKQPKSHLRYCNNVICGCMGCINFTGVSEEELKEYLKENL